MICKTVFLAFLAVGVLAEYKLPEEQRQQYKKYLTEACKKNGAEDKVESVENAIKDFVDCGKKLFDPETIKQEIEAAKPNGALDEVFKKYCAKSPELKTCLHALTSGVAPCLDPSIRNELSSADNTTDQLIDFVCYKDGDRIALFIAEQGPECFMQKTDAIRACGNKIKEGINSIDDARALTTAQQCAKYDELTACIVTALEECDTPTPGNMAESLFRYIRKTTPCKN